MTVRYKREGQKDCICLPQRCIPYDPAVIDVQVIDDGVYASYSGEEQYGTVAYIKEGEAYVFLRKLYGVIMWNRCMRLKEGRICFIQAVQMR